jgi:hypothetical protein
MNTFVTIAAAGLAAVALSACVEESSTRSEQVARAPSTHAPENLAERKCTEALARQLKVPASDLSIISTRFTGDELRVTVRVPTAEQPWACIMDRDARLVRTEYQGEG